MHLKQALKHLEAMGFKDGDEVRLRGFFPEKGDGGGRKEAFTMPEIPVSAIEEWENDGIGTYLVVNSGGDLDESITKCRAIFYEHDRTGETGLPKLQEMFPEAVFAPTADFRGAKQWNVPKGVQQALWRLLGLPEPTVQVDSGGKSVHSFWVFSELIDTEVWRSLQFDLLEFADADRTIKNPSRVMRLAGCRNALTGELARIVGGCGKPYSFEEMRSAIPVAEVKPFTQKKGVTWAEFNQKWRFPIPDSVPLEACLSRANRALLDDGEQNGSRNESGFKLAADLLAVTSHLTREGQRFDGDPYDLFLSYCQRCAQGEGWTNGEWDSLWKSAQKKSRNSSLTPEMIENCVKGWAWSNCPDRVMPDVSGIGKAIPPARTVAMTQAPDGATDEERLRIAISDYNRVLDAGNRFQSLPMRRQLAKEWGLSVAEIDELSRELMRSKEGDLVSLYASIDEIQQEILDRSKTTEIPGISTGFRDLDAITQGIHPGELIVMAGRPAMGKTAALLAIGRNIAVMKKLPVAVFSLEMARKQLAYRLLSIESGVQVGRLRSGRVASHEWEPIGVAGSVLAQAPIYIDDTPQASTSDILTKCRRLQSNVGEIGCIAIDYLQLIAGAADDAVHSLEKITAELKALSRELNTPVIALSQLSRGVESRDNKRPMMSDIRNSGGIEQNADLIVMLYRDEYYNPETEDVGVAELILAKHRNGPVGTVKLSFEPEFTRFSDMDVERPKLKQKEDDYSAYGF